MKFLKQIGMVLFFIVMMLLLPTEKVGAKTFSTYQTKIPNRSSYYIFSRLTKKGPRGILGTTGALRKSNFQSKTERKSKTGRYCFVYVDGHRAGWVNKKAFAKNKLSLAHHVSLVYNSADKFNTRDAINYAVDSHGNALNPSKIHVSQKYIHTNKIGWHVIKYSYGKAHAKIVISVRNDKREGIIFSKVKAKKSTSFLTWKHHFKTSGNWGKGKSFAPETRSHTLKSGPFTLKTVFYQPATLNIGCNPLGALGPTPEGITLSSGRMYATMYLHPYLNHARIISYRLKRIPKYQLQKLPWLPWNEFYRLAKKIKVSPYLKLGHGQTLSSTKKYLYVVANDHGIANSPRSEEIMQLGKKDLQLKRIWTFKVWHNNVRGGRYFHNAVFINDHSFYAVFRNHAKRRFEYWQVTRHGNRWSPRLISATKAEFMKNGSPVQGFTYDKRKKQFYLAFNDYLLKIAKNGRLISNGHFKTGREFEGISFYRHRLYAELAERPELLVN